MYNDTEFEEKMTNYTELNKQLYSLICGVPHKIANLANASALLYNTLDNLNWAGFYLTQGDRLVLGQTAPAKGLTLMEALYEGDEARALSYFRT